MENADMEERSLFILFIAVLFAVSAALFNVGLVFGASIPAMDSTSIQVSPPGISNVLDPKVKVEEFNPAGKIDYKNGHVTADLKGATLDYILKILGEKAGFKINSDMPAFNAKITTNFRNVELEQALDHVFSLSGIRNYILAYDKNGRITSIIIEEDQSQPAQFPSKNAVTSQPAKEPSAGLSDKPKQNITSTEEIKLISGQQKQENKMFYIAPPKGK